MLTGEHEAVDLSMLVSEGLLGLSQSVMRQVHVHVCELKGPSVFSAVCLCNAWGHNALSFVDALYMYM